MTFSAKISNYQTDIVVASGSGQVIPVSVLRSPNQVPVYVIETLGIPAHSKALLTGRTVGIKGTILVEQKYKITSQNASLYPGRY